MSKMLCMAEVEKMIALLDTSEDLQKCREEMGIKVEQLLTPLTRFRRQDSLAKFAIDNGAFAGFRNGEFQALLLREKDAKHLCRFVAVPDVVGDARRTLEVFDHYKYSLKGQGWKLAYVAQNGAEDHPIPWNIIDAIFIGGKDKGDGRGDWKYSESARAIIRAAQAIGKWVHVGRVNGSARYDYFDKLDVDSIDGTGISKYSHMREKLTEGLPLLDAALTLESVASQS